MPAAIDRIFQRFVQFFDLDNRNRVGIRSDQRGCAVAQDGVSFGFEPVYFHALKKRGMQFCDFPKRCFESLGAGIDDAA